MNARKPRIVRCPQCAGDVEWVPGNRWRPFCSERCRQIDLGAWASDAYRVPATSSPDSSGSDPTDGDSEPR